MLSVSYFVIFFLFCLQISVKDNPIFRCLSGYSLKISGKNSLGSYSSSSVLVIPLFSIFSSPSITPLTSLTMLCSLRPLPYGPRFSYQVIRLLSTAVQTMEINGARYKTVPGVTNATPTILKHVGKNLHLKPNHPVNILRELIENKLNSVDNAFTTYNNYPPVVTVFENFDSLGFPRDHPGRSKSDTYYINNEYLLRTHTSAHEMECYSKLESDPKRSGFLISADVYRRDEIDRTHYPVFHQMEGCRIWRRGPNMLEQIRSDLATLEAALDKEDLKLVVTDESRMCTPENPKQSYMTYEEVDLVSRHLKRSIELIICEVFNKKIESLSDPLASKELKVRWIDAYFPWTTPSWEIEVWWGDEWLELCGCGVVQQQVLLNAEYPEDSTVSWAFGLGLDRIAMLLFEIPDIRLLWTQDERFTSQFKDGTITSFKPYSKYPGTKRDMAFWLPEGQSADNSVIHDNDVMEIVRGVAGDLVESVKLIDRFMNKKLNRTSLCYRINYQSMDRNVTNSEVNALQAQVEKELVHKYHVEIR